MLLLLEQAKILTLHGFPVIPIKNKRPVLDKWTDRRKQLATQQELVTWFSNGKADSVAITINNTEFAIDTDGKCEEVFLENLLTQCSEELQKKIKGTMHTKTPNGHHRTFKINSEDFPDGIPEKTYLTLKGEHDEIALKGRRHYLVERGPGYEIINDIQTIVTLTKGQVDELLSHLEHLQRQQEPKKEQKHRDNTSSSSPSPAATINLDSEKIKKIAGIIQTFYLRGNRDEIAFALTGYLHRRYISEASIIDIVGTLAQDDEEKGNRIRVAKLTCKKNRGSKEISGFKRFVTAICSAIGSEHDGKEIIGEIAVIIEQARLEQGFEPQDEKRQKGGDKSTSYTSSPFTTTSPVEEQLSKTVLAELERHIYKITCYNPLSLTVAHTDKKEILDARVKKLRGLYAVAAASKDGGKVETDIEDPSSSSVYYEYLQYTGVIIDAIPIKVTIYDNPVDKTRKLQILFESRSSKKPFNIGPGSISSIIEELQNRNKVIKKGLALDALTAIISAYEGMDKAVINDEITTPGYYYLNRQVKGYETTQRQLEESGQFQIQECIEVLDGLAQRYRKKAVFPTIIKWAVLAPFSYIKKGDNITTDNWLPFLQPYGRTRAGKSTLGVIVLAVWRKHGNSEKRDHQLGFGNIDSVARFGNAISKTTYPILVNEVGALASDKYYYLVEMIKHSVESQTVRGKFVEGRYYTEIPALSAMILTSNYPPPVDPAYKVRVVPIHFTKEDSPSPAQKEEFKRWFFEDRRVDKLGILGDFAVKHILANPDMLRNKRWEELGKVIISEFYIAANRQAPEWIDYLVEENVIEDTNDETHFELRSFIMDIITNTYSRHIKTLTANRDIVLDISFGSRLDFCLDNDLVPFLHQRNYQNKTKDAKEITITADIFSELRKQKIQNITHMRDLATELGFDYCSRRLGGTKTKVVCGPREEFIRFLDSQIKDQEEVDF